MIAGVCACSQVQLLASFGPRSVTTDALISPSLGRSSPVRLEVPEGAAVSAVCAGFRASGVVTEAGQLFTVGSNSGAILGHSYGVFETTELSIVNVRTLSVPWGRGRAHFVSLSVDCS